MQNLQLRDKDDSFNILAHSFDPRGSATDMNPLAQRYGPDTNKQWTFAVTDSIDRLDRSIGFYPIWDNEGEQYDHDASLGNGCCLNYFSVLGNRIKYKGIGHSFKV